MYLYVSNSDFRNYFLRKVLSPNNDRAHLRLIQQTENLLGDHLSSLSTFWGSLKLIKEHADSSEAN